MATTSWRAHGTATDRASMRWITGSLLALGTAARLWLGARNFLNPDEALHYFVAAQPTLAQTYKVSLTTAHPPLMFFLLHGWIRLGSSELVLRLPFVAAGVLFAAIFSLWVRRVAGETAALFSLAICLFSPALISLSAEVRQYSLLLLFCALCLYALDRALQERSPNWLMLSAVALWLALLTHYSALIFAAAAGAYGLVRLTSTESLGGRVRATWVLGQALALAICAVLFKTQVSKLRQSGVPSEIAATWLSTSVFHDGSDHVAFAFSRTVRLFRYFFSHGTIGVFMLALFTFAVVALWAKWQRDSQVHHPRALALLLTLPFAIALVSAFAGLYPYGGTRHDIVLMLFAIPGIGIGVDVLKLGKPSARAKLAALVLLLVLCNVFASPTPPFIRPQNQRKALMENAVQSLRSQPSSSAMLADYQGGLVLGYYLCDKTSSLPFGVTPKALEPSACSDKTLLTSLGTQNGLELRDLPSVLQQAWRAMPVTISNMWLFQTGWIDDEPAKWNDELRKLHCGDIRNFGANVRVSRCERSSPD